MTASRNLDIRTSSFRVVHKTPSHTTFGIWINGAKSGDLVARNEEADALRLKLKRGGFTEMVLLEDPLNTGAVS